MEQINAPDFSALLRQLVSREGQTPAARTIELFGWLILLESPVMLFAPNIAAAVLHLPTLSDQAVIYFRLMGLLVGGLGMLYVVSGRLNARGFVFASMLERPLVPIIMAILWLNDMIPGPLALAFAVQDFGSFLWTAWAWRKGR